MKIMGFAGKAGTGKDTCARLVREISWEKYNKNVANVPLAESLKARTYAEMAGRVSFEDVYYNKPPEIRYALQRVGTEKGRDVYGEDFWTLQAEASIRRMADNMPFVDGVTVSDVRFPNEAEFVRLGGRSPSSLIEEISSEDDLEPREIEQAYLDELQAGPGIVLWIVSDRTTLSGDAATHRSETGFEHVNKYEYFDGVITNNWNTSLDDLRMQLEPYVETMLTCEALSA